MSTSHGGDAGLPAAVDHPNKKFTTIIIYPTGKETQHRFGKTNVSSNRVGKIRFSDAGEDHHSHGVVHPGLPTGRTHDHMLFAAQSQIGTGPRSPQKLGVST